MWCHFNSLINRRQPPPGTRLLRLFIALVLASCMARAALADEPYNLGEIVVTASRVETPLGEAPANVTVITAEQITQMGAQSLVDVFDREPGIFAQNYLGNPKTGNIDIRGYGEAAPQNVLFLVNGRRVNSIDLSGADLSQIPVDAVERIEVYRGPASVLYGDNAAAGAVNIILKAGEGPPKGWVAATYGSYDTFKPEAMVSGSQNQFSYMVFASHLDTGGYRENNGLHANDLLGNFSIEPSDHLKVSLSTGTHADSYGMPGYILLSQLRSGVNPRDSIVLGASGIPTVRAQLQRTTASSTSFPRSGSATMSSSPSGLLTGTATKATITTTASAAMPKERTSCRPMRSPRSCRSRPPSEG